MRNIVGLVLFAISESSRNTVFTYNAPAYHNDSDSEYLRNIKSCHAVLKTNYSVVSSMYKGFVKAIPAKVKRYLRENWGAPFIVGFMLLLMAAAASLSMGLAALANDITIYAYYALVIGVFLQLAYFLKYTERNGEKNYESS
jgi:hypothetical protein